MVRINHFFFKKFHFPLIAINPTEPIETAYVPSHLYHVMFELFKVMIK